MSYRSTTFFIDSYFNRSVILICEHNKNGSLGFQVNKPLKNNLNDFLKNIKTKKEVYLGGPVNNNNLYFIHCYNNLEKESVKINPGNLIKLISESNGDIRSLINSAQALVTGFEPLMEKSFESLDVKMELMHFIKQNQSMRQE